MTNTDRFRSGIAGALIALMLATAVSAASDGHQMLLEKRAVAEAAAVDSQSKEELARQDRIGSGIATGAVVIVAIGLGLIFLGLSKGGAGFPNSGS